MAMLPTVFLSYSHEDEAWKDRILPHLNSLVNLELVDVWHDRRIDAGQSWYPEIRSALERAKAAVCLISHNYLASPFCIKEEIPFLLERCADDGMLLLPVLLTHCSWQLFPWLSGLQMLPRDAKPLEGQRRNINKVFNEISQSIAARFTETPTINRREQSPSSLRLPEKIDIARLPVTGAELFGRSDELNWLDQVWEESNTRIAVIVAWGGAGKTTLINKWLELSAKNHFNRARKVFGWTFYSQGMNERASSADLFFRQALHWFGDPRPERGSPWSKAERLFDLVLKDRTLLVLDGLEPLQSAAENGAINDPALSTFLTGIARSGAQGQGLCIVTTRSFIPDLAPFSDSVAVWNLERMSADAGRAFLRIGGVSGSDVELEEVVQAFGGHALALRLLGAYLRDTPGHPGAAALKIPHLNLLEEEGLHPRRVIEALVHQFGAGSEIELLRLLGLFDRPADASALKTLCAVPIIPSLTENLVHLADGRWQAVVNKLRRIGLVAESGGHDSADLDCHPLVREHFSEQVRKTNPLAWQEAHSRLFEHFRLQVGDNPRSVEDLGCSYSAIVHGCQAGRYREALNDVFIKQILHGQEFFTARKLGAYSADLAALKHFYFTPGDTLPDELTQNEKAFISSYSGTILRALGELSSATRRLETGLELYKSIGSWREASIYAGRLSELYQTRGNLKNAIEFAILSLKLAEQSEDTALWLDRLTTFADALHQFGHFADSLFLFSAAETMQRRIQPKEPYLYSHKGFIFCDLLFTTGDWQQAETRAKLTIERVRHNGPLLAIARDYLSLARASVERAVISPASDFGDALELIELAVDGLRHAGTRNELPRGLLARAALHRMRQSFQRARTDLEEALELSARCGMYLFLADCQLEAVRLHLAQGEVVDAREALWRGQGLVSRLGYRRRRTDVVTLEHILGPTTAILE